LVTDATQQLWSAPEFRAEAIAEVMEVNMRVARNRSLSREIAIGDGEIAERKRFLEFGDEDVDRLTRSSDIAEQYADDVIEAFYRHLLAFEETRAFLRDPAVLAHVKAEQRAYFVRLTQGDYGPEYVEDRLSIGATHERIGLPVKTYLGMYNFYLRAVATKLFQALADDPERALATFLSLTKLTFLDMGLAIDTYIAQRERTIVRQQGAIRALSTPVLQVRDRLLILPVIGEIDGQRARLLTRR
jgi:rsbT co-antagonist protein RsbR